MSTQAHDVEQGPVGSSPVSQVSRSSGSSAASPQRTSDLSAGDLSADVLLPPSSAPPGASLTSIPLVLLFGGGPGMDPTVVPSQTRSHLDALLGAGARIIAVGWPMYDARRHRLRGRATLGQDAQVRAVAALVDVLAPPPARVVLWGHSAAAGKLLAYTLSSPGRVAGLILSDPAAEKVRLPARALLVGYGALLLLSPFGGRERAFLRTYPRLMRRLYFAHPTRELTRTFAAGFRRPFLANLLERDALDPPLDRLWAQTTAETLGDLSALLLVGEQDRVTPPACIARLRDHLQRAGARVDLAQIKGAGHFPLWERPAVGFAAVQAFLAQLTVHAAGDVGDGGEPVNGHPDAVSDAALEPSERV